MTLARCRRKRVCRELRQADVADLACRVDHVVPVVVGLALEAEDRFDLDAAAGDLESSGLLRPRVGRSA